VTTWNVTLDRIVSESAKVSPGRVFLTIITFPFFLIGWIIGLIFTAVLLLWSAGVVGFRTARTVRARGN